MAEVARDRAGGRRPGAVATTSAPTPGFGPPAALARRTMKLLHLLVGALALLVFLLTGQYMDYLDVRSGALGETARVMYRSRHIYLLLAGLVNLGLGSYYGDGAGGGRKAIQVLGSALVLLAPALLLAAFFTEPGSPGLPRHFTLPAVVILSVGTLLHAFGGLRRGAGRRAD